MVLAHEVVVPVHIALGEAFIVNRLGFAVRVVLLPLGSVVGSRPIIVRVIVVVSSVVVAIVAGGTAAVVVSGAIGVDNNNSVAVLKNLSASFVLASIVFTFIAVSAIAISAIAVSTIAVSAIAVSSFAATATSASFEADLAEVSVFEVTAVGWVSIELNKSIFAADAAGKCGVGLSKRFNIGRVDVNVEVAVVGGVHCRFISLLAVVKLGLEGSSCVDK